MLKMVGPCATPLGPMWLIEGDVVSDTLRAGKNWDSHVYEALEPYLRKDAAVIDVGANVGPHALRFAEKARKVICFEPHPVMSFCLRANMRGRKAEFHGGLYSRKVALVVRQEEGNSPSSLTWLPGEGGVDAGPYFTEERVSAIKVDAQGADLHCLLGLHEIIERDQPAIVFEYEEHLAKLHGHDWLDYTAELYNWGYTFKRVQEGHEDFLATLEGK